jgi:hypothetical protein
MNIFDEALKSLQEAIDYENGDTSKGRTVIREVKPDNEDELLQASGQ